MPRTPNYTGTTRHITAISDEVAWRKGQKLRKRSTGVCDAIDLIMSRIATLDSDEHWERRGKPAPGTDLNPRAPLAYKTVYKHHLGAALRALVEAEDLHLRQRDHAREQRAKALEGLTQEERLAALGF